MKKMILSSIVIASILVLATSLISVVGTTSTSTGTLQSPLFTLRTQQSNHVALQRLHTNYLGKGTPQLLSFSSRSSIDDLVNNAVRFINQNPNILDTLAARMQKIPATARVLAKYGMSQSELQKYITQIKNDPSLLRQQLDEAKAEIQTGGATHPLSLNTTNPFACVITIIALLPVIAALLVVVLIIATITIVTCLNVNNCLTNLTDQLQNIITQHLLPP